jgi:hypothetical protein
MVSVLGQDGRPGGRIQLLTVDAKARQVWPDQDAPQRRGTPTAGSCGGDAACIQLPTERGEGLTSEGAARHLPNDGRLIRFDALESRR